MSPTDRSSLGSRLAQRGDLILALLIVLVVGVILVPLPTLALDVLLSVNFTAAIVLLLVGLQTSSPLNLSALPGLLLVTTLFRLGLNVSSTRLILLQADAGAVIDAFGRFVVRGDYVVGAVVFLIITLVQFLVIARGSERVAEVAARFTLDAMPGRQMAIDADLRAGALTLEEAQAQRRSLQLESQLYGALDGAMKFVKGDAIAGLLITVINIAGGLAIGVLQRGLPLSEAARTYTLLTIGDGLVSQIPALLIATAAGLIVTRVDAGSGHLGADAARQLLRHPSALGVAAMLLVALALAPGLPGLPFLLMAALTGALAWLARTSKADDDAPIAEDAVQPLRLAIGAQLAEHLADPDMNGLRAALNAARDDLRAELGLPTTPVQLSIEGEGWEARVDIDEIPALETRVSPGFMLTDADAAPFDALGIAFEPVPGYALCWVEAADEPEFADDALTPSDALVRLVTAAVRRHGSLLLGIQEVQRLLDQLRERVPADVEAVVPAVMSVPELTWLLRRLLDESLSIRNLRIILSAVAERAEDASEPLALLGEVRVALRRQITHAFASGDQLEAWLVEREVERTVRDAVARRDTRQPDLQLPPRLRDAIRAGARRVAEGAGASPTVLVLTEQDVRPFLHALLVDDIPGLVTLAYAELNPDLQIKPLGHLSARSGLT